MCGCETKRRYRGNIILHKYSVCPSVEELEGTLHSRSDEHKKGIMTSNLRRLAATSAANTDKSPKMGITCFAVFGYHAYYIILGFIFMPVVEVLFNYSFSHTFSFDKMLLKWVIARSHRRIL